MVPQIQMEEIRKQHHRLHQDFVCGLGAACVEIVLTFPLNKLIFRQQLHNIYAKQAAGQLFSEGFRYLYRGLLPPLCQKAPSRAIMFGMFDVFSAFLNCNDKLPPFSPCRSSAAFLAGCTEAVLSPFERIQTLLQTARYHAHFKNTVHAFREVGRVYGFREYYRGLTIILMRNGPTNVIYFSCREPLHDFSLSIMKKYTNIGHEMDELTSHFIAGALLGASLSTLSFPLNVIKFRLQSRLGGNFESFSSAFREIMKERNYQIRELFRGVHLNCTRSLLTWGITNTMFELLKRTLFNN